MALRKISLSLVALAALSSGAFAADATATYGNGLADAFAKGKVDGEVRGLYMLQNNQMYNTSAANNNNSAFAAGGNLGFTTAPYYGIQAGAKFYTTQVLASSANFNGNATQAQASLAPYFENSNNGVANVGGNTPQSYSTLGQAYLQGAYGKTIVKVGRQQLDTPLAGSDDNYMIPNLFQAGVLINQDIPGTTIVAAYVNGMQGGTTGDSHSNVNPQTAFSSMSRSALGSLVNLGTGLNATNTGVGTGSSIGDKPVFAVALLSDGIPYVKTGVWYYNNTDVLSAMYLNADSNLPSMAGFTPYASIQWYNLAAQGATKTLLTNFGAGQANSGTPASQQVNNLNYSVTGFKLGTSTPLGLTPEVAANFIGGKTNTVYVFNAWGGTPNYTDMAYVNMSNFAQYVGGLGNGGSANPKGANVWKFSLNQDLKKFNLGDRSISAAFGIYDFAKSNNTAGAAQNQQNVDVAVWDVVYSCKNALVKNLELKVFWENVKYNSAWQNISTTAARTNNIASARAIYGF